MKNILLLSGGVDSMVCLHLLKEQGISLYPMFIEYNQAAKKRELQSSSKISEHYGLSLNVRKLEGSNSKGKGFVPGRNTFLFSTALMEMGEENGFIVSGIHGGTNYFDCSEDYFERIKHLVIEETSGKVELVAPLLKWNKSEILHFVKTNKLPYELTYSCEEGEITPCGRCLSCRDRKLIDDV